MWIIGLYFNAFCSLFIYLILCPNSFQEQSEADQIKPEETEDEEKTEVQIEKEKPKTPETLE